MKKDVPLYRPNLGKLIIAIVGTVFFFVGGAVIILHLREAQANGVPLRNGNGDVVSSTKVYLGAGAMFLAAFLYGWRARVVIRQRKLAKG